MSPAVNLDLQEVPFAILEVVKARILANRRRLGAGQDQQKPPPSLKPRPQLRKFGASSKNYRRPEPAATGGETSPHNMLWYSMIQKASEGGDTSLKLYSGDLSKSLSIEFTSSSGGAGQFGIYSHLVCLPLDRTTCIALLYIQTISCKAFIVGRTFVREISNVPIRIKQLFLYDFLGSPQLNYSPTFYSGSCIRFGDLLATKVTINVDGVNQTTFAYLENFVDFYGPYDTQLAAVLLNEFSGVSYVTPAAYKMLNNLSLAYSLIAGYDVQESSYYIPPSARSSVYQAFSDNLPDKYSDKWLAVSRLDPTFATALRYESDAPPTVVTFPDVDGQDDPRWKRLRKNPLIAQKPPTPQYAAQAATWLAPYFYWDWGKPDYCREQLLALGFTESDLTP
jgi:hypothetical protein